MSKQQQSRSKSAFRGWIGYTAKIISLYSGNVVTDDVDLQNVLNEARLTMADAQTEIFDGVLFSATRNIDLWNVRFEERATLSLDKIRDALERQLNAGADEDEKAFRAAAKAFGTDPGTYAEFLQLGITPLVQKDPRLQERGTAFTNLKDIINVYRKIAFATEYVRFDGRYYHARVTDSGRRRTSSRRTRTNKTRKKKVRV